MAITEEMINTLVLRLYRGVREVPFTQFREYALTLIKPALNFDAAIWGMGMHEERGTYIGSAHLHGLPPSIMEDYARGVRNQDITAERITAQFGRTISMSIDDPELATERCAKLRAHRHKYGLMHLLSTALPEPALGLGHFISLFRSDTEQPWTEASRQLKERLFPHLIEAFMQARYLHMKQEVGVKIGHIITNRALLTTNVTPVFRQIMLREWPNWSGLCMPPEVCSVFSDEKFSYYRGKQVVISIEPDQQLVHLTIRVRNPLDVLSVQELNVAQQFARGLAHKEIAKENGVSPHTVRNQIRAIYFKLGVSTKTSLATCLKDML